MTQSCDISEPTLNLFMKWIPETQLVSDSNAGQLDLEAILRLNKLCSAPALPFKSSSSLLSCSHPEAPMLVCVCVCDQNHKGSENGTG